MRVLGLGVGFAIVVVAVSVVGACSSSDDTTEPTMTSEAGADAPVTMPPGDAASDSPVTATPSLQHSGTRLQLEGFTTSEGTFVERGLYDSKLATECTTARLADGNWHCVPTITGPLSGYSDDQCTIGLASQPAGSCTPLKFGSIGMVGANPCDYRQSLYRVGAKIATPAMVYVKSGASCVAAPVSANDEYYLVVAAMQPSEFVAFHSAEVVVTPSVRAIVFDGDDGSRLQRGPFVDGTRKKACDVTLAADGKTRCTPRASAQTGNVFSDLGCASAAADPAECTVPGDVFDDTTATTTMAGKCTLNTIRAFTLGAKRATRDEYTKDGDGGCAGPATSPRDVYDVGPELAATTFPEITVGTAGGPRIVEQTYASGNVVIEHTGGLRDTTLGVTCQFGKASDGKIRCLPTGVGGFYFSDNMCQVPLGVTSDACEEAASKYVVVMQGAACAATTHVYALGAKLDPKSTTAFISSGGSCLQIGGTSAIAYYMLGAEVPPATFAEGTPVTK